MASVLGIVANLACIQVQITFVFFFTGSLKSVN